MIFPIPMSMGGPMDPPPSEAALKMRPIFWVVIGLQMLGGIARFIFLDIWGGIMSFFLAGIGSYAVKSNMELTWICCYGLCSFMNGLVDLVQAVEVIVRLRDARQMENANGQKIPHDARYIFYMAVLIGVPIINLTASVISVLVFRAALNVYEPVQDIESYAAQQQQAEQANLLNASQGPGQNPPGFVPRNTSSNFTAFSGQGTALGRPQRANSPSHFQTSGTTLGDTNNINNPDPQMIPKHDVPGSLMSLNTPNAEGRGAHDQINTSPNASVTQRRTEGAPPPVRNLS